MATALLFDTLVLARDAVASRRVSSAELTRHVLDRIERLDPDVRAFLATYPERALEQARAVDQGRRGGALVLSLRSCPAITFSISAASATVRPKGPTWSRELA